MRLRWFLIPLIILAVGVTESHSKRLVPSIGQGDDQKNEWALNTESGVPFWIGLNLVSAQTLTSFREIIVFVEPQRFTEGNLRKVFLYLSAEFPLPEMLSIIARSDREKLQRLVNYHRYLNSLKRDDPRSRRAVEGKLEEASALARSGCYRADYIRMNLNERFNYYPEPDKEDGYAVVLKSGPAKFEPTENAVSDLVRASKLGLINYVRVFLDQGTDVNAMDQYGYTPLFTAVLWRQRDVVEMLLDRGARVDSKGPSPPGWTPLMCALSLSRLNDTGLAEELLRRGADVNARGDDGETVLTLATKKGQKKVIEELLRRGADVNAKDASGRTALLIAEQNALKEISYLLRKAGATRY